MSAPTRDPMLDAIECPECGKEFLPTKSKPGPTCGQPKCNGAMGAEKRNYRKPKLSQRPRFRK